MALDRVRSEYVFRSGTPNAYHTFVVAVDSGNRIYVRDFQTPQGRLADSYTALPSSVTDDVQLAISQVRNFLAQSSSVNGQITFTATATATVTFPTPMASTTYRVVFSLADFVPARVSSKTVNGFVVELGTTYTGTVGYDVFV